LTGLPVLSIAAPVEDLARRIVQAARLPERAVADAVHVSVAAVHGIDYLLTWNVRHIANAEVRRTVEEACRSFGFKPPVLCTPEELMGL
jgi:predicted nucleic acid-binding protein